jgi:hypothetical protein
MSTTTRRDRKDIVRFLGIITDADGRVLDVTFGDVHLQPISRVRRDDHRTETYYLPLCHSQVRQEPA